jgi:SsrA-binding protein
MYTVNKTARREYEILDQYEAGVALYGSEVKSIRSGGMKFDGAFVKIIDGELFLINVHIRPYSFARSEDYDPQRSRRLLLHKKELLRISIRLSQGSNLTIIPLSCYNKNGLIKVKIGLVKGKKTWEKKRVDKDRSERKRERSEAKEYLKRG